MFNPWGLLFVIVGVVFVLVGMQGTQSGVYTFLTGKLPKQQNLTPFAPYTTYATDKTVPK